MEKELILKGKCLYTPGGAAREYAAVGCNFYRGCPFQCQYCYNRKGMTASVNGLSYAVLSNDFTMEKNRPKKYRHLSPEDYALLVFKRECEKWLDHLRRTGIFFSFTTDPLSELTCALTIEAALHAAKSGIPVKILTKNAGGGKPLFRKFIDSPWNDKIALGFTLTGRDDQEPHAPTNAERIETMKFCHQWGMRTFASIEPVVDFDSSYRMIEETVGSCDEYLIGLMSSRKANGFEPYDFVACDRFVNKVATLAFSRGLKIYWKDSIRTFDDDGFTRQNVFENGDISVGRDWNLFYKR